MINVKRLRDSLKMTPAEFALLIGVSRTTLWRLETSGKQSKTLIKLLEVIALIEKNHSEYFCGVKHD